MSPIDFGDTVRIRSTPLTESAGVAGLVGPVFGVTTPSVTRVAVIGELADDRAINVFFKARGEGLWFAPELLEFVDHGAGAVVTLNGVKESWTRAADGTWVEQSSGKPTPDLFARFLDVCRRLFK